MTENKAEDWLLIGKIVGAHGLNGHLKVRPESDFPERFTQPGDRWLKKPGSEPVQIKLTSGRYLEGKNQYLVKLAGVDYRDQAEDLRSAELVVRSCDRLALEPGEFHVSDLIGLTVVMKADQSTVGIVQDVYTTGHDMLEVVVSPELLSQLAEKEGSNREKEVVDASEKEKDSPDSSHPSIRAKAARKLKLKEKKKRKKKPPKTLLIPFVEEIVPIVDIASGRIEITPPPGLIDL